MPTENEKVKTRAKTKEMLKAFQQRRAEAIERGDGKEVAAMEGYIEAAKALIKNNQPVSNAELDAMIDAGLAAVDLFRVASEDVITRGHLRQFLKAALAEPLERKILPS